MVDAPTRDRRAERHAATRAEILDTAWQLVRQHGLAGLSLRDVAHAVGLRPPSLYWYVDSKHALYDAMFAQANQQLLDRLDAQTWPSDARGLLRQCARVFVQFCAEDVQRYQLLFQRTVPDFTPSATSYALAVQVYDQMRQLFARVGLSDQRQFDLWTALVAGLSAQQTSNEPGGDRWLRLVDEAVDMFADHFLPRRSNRNRR
jgi:AcrR family transcriptional regulator